MITTVTMNASLDKAYFMDKAIENGTVMRVKRARTSAGGKGLNVARAIALCGGEVLATGLVGGFNGQQLCDLLDRDGIAHRFGQVAGETRCCINVLDPAFGSTEYLEPGCEVSGEEQAAFMAEFPQIIAESDVVTISGSLPQGMEKDFYARMVELIKGMGKRVILDSSGELLQKGLLACPTLVKPNKDEMEQLFGHKIESFEEIVAGAKRIHEMGIPYVVISLGGDGALLVCGDGVFHGRPPKVEVVNTVGCGDSMVGALAVALEREYEPERALRFAVSVATANALSPNTGDFDPEKQRELETLAVVERL